MPDYSLYGQLDDQQTEEGDASFQGVNARLAPEQLGPGLVADAQNVRMRNGQPETRPGVMKPGWLNKTNADIDDAIRPVSKFYGSGVFKDPNGSEWVLLVADGNIYRCKPHNARTALPLPAGVTLVTDCVPVQAFNLVYLFRGRHLQPLVMDDIDDGFHDLLPRWDASTPYQAAVLAVGTPAAEVAYGPFQTIDTLTSVGQTATAVTHVEHGYVTGADVTIRGATPAAYNGRFTITVIDTTTFTYSFLGGASPATGTIEVSNMAYYWQAKGTVRQVSSLTRVGPTATATTTVAHGFVAGQSVTIAGATGADLALWNGTFVIQVPVTATTFAYTMAGTPAASPATGTITAKGSVVESGQSPDSNPEAWQQIYNVLPNADDAIFTDNRLLVPTAYTPGVVDYDSTSTYTKKDFIVAMDIGDNIHFLFTNELRINQGSDDEIVVLVKFDSDTVIVVKTKSWGVLTGLAGGDLTTVHLDMKPDTYGGCSMRSGVCAGKNILFPSSQRGICGLLQTQQGETRSVDVPFSNDLFRVVRRIDWRQADKIRLAWWDDKLYCAVPLLAERPLPQNLVPDIAQYVWVVIHPGIQVAKYFITSLLTVGTMYHFKPYHDGDWLAVNGRNLMVEGDFLFDGGTVQLLPSDELPGPVLSQVYQVGAAAAGNNSILVYDFRRGMQNLTYSADFQSGQWDGYDTGTALRVKEFFLATYNGKQRLFFIAEDGYCNIMEEAEGSDQVGDASRPNALTWEQILMSVDTRGYAIDKSGPQWFRDVSLGFDVWNAAFSITLLTGQANYTKALRKSYTFSRTKYLVPVGRMSYVEGNTNNDFFEPGRGDYSVRLLDGITPGYSTEQFQEVTIATPTRSASGRFVQFRITNTQGRLRVKAVVPVMSTGWRRKGVKL